MFVRFMNILKKLKHDFLFGKFHYIYIGISYRNNNNNIWSNLNYMFKFVKT